MDSLLSYLLKVSAGTIALYVLFILFFSKDTFYKRNRIFLLLILILPAIIPVFRVISTSGNPEPVKSIMVLRGFIASGNQIDASLSEKINSFNYYDLLLWSYFSVTAILLVLLIVSVIKTWVIIRKGTIQDKNFPKVVLSDASYPVFSFFPFVVIPGNIYRTSEYTDILEHEYAHVRQGHTFDLILSEIFIAFLWFNPVLWLIKRSIIFNHEYLADKASVVSSKNSRDYQYKLLNISAHSGTLHLAHNFSSSIKTRLVMINKKQTGNFAALKNILILPMVAILFILFSFRPVSNSLNRNSQEVLFSDASTTEILTFLGRNSMYPQEAKNSLDTGSIFVVLKVGKGGIIKEAKAFTDKKNIKLPVMPEIVIVGYKPSGIQSVTGGKEKTDDHPALKSECLRIANLLGGLKIPEWNEKDMEFALHFTFVLKDERTSQTSFFTNTDLKSGIILKIF